MFQNFSLVYLRYGYPRLAPADQVRILPSLLLSLQSRTAQQDRYNVLSWSSHALSLSPSVLQLCVPALVHLQWPQDIRLHRDLLPLSDHSDVRKILVEFLLLYLLLPYGCVQLLLLTLDVHAQRGLLHLVCVSVCLFAAHERYQWVQNYASLKNKKIFLKRMRSGDMP